MSDHKQVDDVVPLRGVIGFNGAVKAGLILHQDDERIIYPLGSTVVVKHLTKNVQHFLQKDGHDNAVSCLALSPDGKFLASGQNAPLGFPAAVIIWNLETYTIAYKLTLHKGNVQSLAFSPSGTYLASLGGRDDNKIIMWDVKSGEAICGAPAANEPANVIKFLNKTDLSFVTGGNYNLRIWEFDRANRKIRPTDCNLGQLKRNIVAIEVDANDDNIYCGTTTGDILKVSLATQVCKTVGPPKRPFSQGLTAVCKTKQGNLVIGTGDGIVAVMDQDKLTVIKQLKLPGHVTSLQLNKAGDHFFVATKECTIHLVHLDSFEYELRSTCHFARINDIAFAANYSELFATCSMHDIRVWNAKNCTELLRIQVPNLECLCVTFSHDGKSILSGWDDGKIRAFKPQSGKLIYVLNGAHAGGVTAITGTKNSQTVLSGGRDGQIRVWSITEKTQRMVVSMKEHKGTINQIVLNHDDSECLSASDDGSCIVWNLERFCRTNCLFATTQFKSAMYHPDQSQIITTGSDRKITYWDAVDGQPIRIMDSSALEINSLAIAADGESFVAGGADKLLKVYSYDEGTCYFKGVGHSGTITKTAIAPDQSFVVTCGDEGAIFVWDLPKIGATASASSPSKAQEELAGSVKVATITSKSAQVAEPTEAKRKTSRLY